MIDDVPLISTVAYEDLVVGTRWGPFAEQLERAATNRLREEIGVPAAGAVAPPSVLPILFLKALRRALEGIPPGGILAKQDFAIHGPLPAEGEVLTEVTVREQYERRGRLYTVFEFDVRVAGARVAGGTMAIVAPEPGEA